MRRYPDATVSKLFFRGNQIFLKEGLGRVVRYCYARLSNQKGSSVRVLPKKLPWFATISVDILNVSHALSRGVSFYN